MDLESIPLWALLKSNVLSSTYRRDAGQYVRNTNKFHVDSIWISTVQGGSFGYLVTSAHSRGLSEVY